MLGNILFFLLAFATLSALLWCGIQLLQDQEDPLGDRVEALQNATLVGGARTHRAKKGKGFLATFLFTLESVPGARDWLKENEKRLRMAGVRGEKAPALYALFNVSFLVLLMGGMIYLQRGNPATNMLGGLAAAFIIAYVLPGFVLQKFAKRYKQRLQEALPDTVDLLGIVLGTGLALDQAMLRVSEEMQHIYPELANELYTVVMQVKAGQERGKAFSQLVRRTGIDDIKSLAAMIIQSERFGTSLSQALKIYADALRMRRRLRAEAAVAKAGIKMLFPIVVFILPVLFVITLVPGMLSMFHNLQLLGGGK
jgi:tight adherence protein C